MLLDYCCSKGYVALKASALASKGAGEVMTGYQYDERPKDGRLDPREADQLRHKIAELEQLTFESMIDTALKVRRFINFSEGLAFGAGIAIVAARYLAPRFEAMLWIAVVVGLAGAVLMGGSALLIRRRRLLFEALNAALLRLLACEPSTPALRAFGSLRTPPGDKESASPLCSHDRTRRPSELEDADSEGGWLLESFGGAARTNSLYKRGALKHEYQLRRLTAGIEGLVELVPEQLRRASVPEFDEALVSVRHNVISLDQTARSLSEVVNAFHSFDPSAIQDSVQQAVSATLLGPPEVDFDGWETLEVVGPDHQPLRGGQGRFLVPEGGPARLRATIGTELPKSVVVDALPITVRGGRRVDSVDFRLDIRSPDIHLPEPSMTMTWATGLAAVAEIPLDRLPSGDGGTIYVTTYIGTHLVQSSRLQVSSQEGRDG